MAVCGGVWWSRFRWRTTRAARTSTCTTSTVASWSGCCAGTTGKCISASSTPPLWRCTADQMMPRCAVLLGCARAVCGVACHWDVFMLSVVLHDADIDEMPCLWHCRRKYCCQWRCMTRKIQCCLLHCTHNDYLTVECASLRETYDMQNASSLKPTTYVSLHPTVCPNIMLFPRIVLFRCSFGPRP